MESQSSEERREKEKAVIKGLEREMRYAANEDLRPKEKKKKKSPRERKQARNERVF